MIDVRTRRGLTAPAIRLGLLLCMLGVLTRHAGAVQDDAGVEVTAEAVETVRRGGGPRATLKAFFDAMEAGNVERATDTFELQSLGSHAEELKAARRLYDNVLLRTSDLSERTEALDDVGVGGEYYIFRTHAEGHPKLPVEIELRRIDGVFFFSSRTLNGLDELEARLADVDLSETLLAKLSALEAMHHRLRGRLSPALLERSFLIENWQWVGLLVLVLVSALIDRFIRRLAAAVARRFARKRKIRLHDEVVLSFGRPLGLLGAALSFELLLTALGLDQGVSGVLTLAAGFMAAVAGVWAAYCLVDVCCDYLADQAQKTSNKFDDMLVPLARRTFKLFVFVVGLVFVASRLSEDLWSVVAGLGLGSLAVGFAARDSIENLFGTFTVLLDKPFQIGDWVIVGGIEGTVETVGFRSTRIRTFYNSLITVPNREFITSAVDNMGERVYRRIKTTLGLTYDTPPEKIEAFCEGVREILRLHPYTRKDYYHVYLNGFGASSLDVLLYCFVETPDWATELREKHRLFADILRLAERLEVSFAFPTQTLHMARAEDPQHGNRPADDHEGALLGLKLAADVVEGSLAATGGLDQKPPPVETSTRPLHGDDGADGG